MSTSAEHSPDGEMPSTGATSSRPPMYSLVESEGATAALSAQPRIGGGVPSPPPCLSLTDGVYPDGQVPRWDAQGHPVQRRVPQHHVAVRGGCQQLGCRLLGGQHGAQQRRGLADRAAHPHRHRLPCQHHGGVTEGSRVVAVVVGGSRARCPPTHPGRW